VLVATGGDEQVEEVDADVSHIDDDRLPGHRFRHLGER
jgi:hypothetical protein